MTNVKRSRLHRVFSRRRWRVVQAVTGVHRIHHILWSYGWRMPFCNVAFFERFGWRRLDPRIESLRSQSMSYHDCTTSGIY